MTTKTVAGMKQTNQCKLQELAMLAGKQQRWFVKEHKPEAARRFLSVREENCPVSASDSDHSKINVTVMSGEFSWLLR